MADIKQFNESKHVKDIPQLVQLAESMRKDQDGGLDVSLSEVLASEKEGLTMVDLYKDLGLNPSIDTIENIFSLPDPSVRWLLPEIIRDALRLGLRKSPIWPSLIAAEQTLKGLSAVIPHWNMSDAAPRITGQGETIGLGDVSFGQKTIKTQKLTRGIKIPYEVRQYVSVNVVSIFLQDFGVKLGQGLDTLMIDVLLNGEQIDGSESAPVVGIAIPGSLVYRDLLTVWVRMGRLGRSPNAIIGGEESAIDTLDLPEFKNRVFGTLTYAKLNVKTPIPQNTDYYVHGAVPSDQQIVIDSSAAIIKYDSQPLLVESEKIVSNQTEATYCSLTTGFAILLRDARVVVDSTLPFSSNGFPAYMDPASEEITIFN